MDLTYFNPNSQKEADFLVGFVARQSTLEFLVKQLSLVQTGQAARHHLIIAPRGFGKTSLLRRIAIEARSNAGLHARFIPLRFREEQHNVISLDVFWRNCLQSLLEAREDEGAAQDELDTLEADWEAHAPRHSLPREAQDGESAWQTLQMRCAALQRRPVLLIDNLDTLLAGLSEQHQWSLRRRLQAADGPVIIAAASRYPDSTHDTNAAFFEFFRIQTLDKLSDKEVFTCLQHIAEHRGKAGEPVRNMLQQDPGRVAALNTLAGGNPRTLSVLYGVLESHMSGDILSQLSAMLDTFTGWYQARTEELPMQARAVFDALALHWDPMTAATLAQATGLDTPAVSSQLSRLEKSGYVETVSLSRNKKGRSGYQVSERFFNIWYLMRNGPRRAKQRIRFLTTFIQSCFSTTERHTLAQAALQDLRAAPEYALALASSVGSKRLRGALLDLAKNRSSEIAEDSEYHPLVEELRAEWGLGSKTNGDADAGRTLFNKAIELSNRGQSEEAIAVYDEIIKRFGGALELWLRELVARAMVNKGHRLGLLERSEEAIAVYDEIIKRFGSAPEYVLRELVAKAMVNKGIRLWKLERSEDAIAVYDAVIVRFGDASEPGLRELVAMAMLSKGYRLWKLERFEEAITVCSQVVERFSQAKEPVLREAVASALVFSGNLLLEKNQLDASESAYRACIERQPNWGGTYNNLGNLLYDFKGDVSGARKAYEEGLSVALNEPALLPILHGNLAYLLALHIGDALAAQEHVARAVAVEGGMPPAGASLLEALLAFAGNAWEWPKVYAAIDKAVASGDNSLWSNYADDLERLLWFIVAKGKGAEFKEWMARANYPTQYAPMFHAFVAALEGEDHLLQINPETRQPASKIYSGIARRLALYERDGSKARKVF
jgi:tetratricopeptide (TPR) repeat protein